MPSSGGAVHLSTRSYSLEVKQPREARAPTSLDYCPFCIVPLVPLVPLRVPLLMLPLFERFVVALFGDAPVPVPMPPPVPVTPGEP